MNQFAVSAPLWLRQFPLYPIDGMPAIPGGFSDASWRQDACPCIASDDAKLIIWIDWPEPEDRMNPDAKRFKVCRASDGDLLIDSDDWRQILYWLGHRHVKEKAQ